MTLQEFIDEDLQKGACVANVQREILLFLFRSQPRGLLCESSSMYVRSCFKNYELLTIFPCGNITSKVNPSSNLWYTAPLVDFNVKWQPYS